MRKALPQHKKAVLYARNPMLQLCKAVLFVAKAAIFEDQRAMKL